MIRIATWQVCLLVGFLCGGCAYYLPLDTRGLADGATYRVDIKGNADGEFQSKITRQTTTRKQTRTLPDLKVECLAVSPDGDLLALGVYRPAAAGRNGSSGVLLLRASSLETASQWPIPCVQGEDVARFDAIAVSPDGQTVATYYWKPPMALGWKPVVTLWNARTGKLLREFETPEPGGPVQATIHSNYATSLAFSANSNQVAVARVSAAKRSQDAPPAGLIQIWRIADGSRIDLRPTPDVWVCDLCFDASGTRLAYWCWDGKGTSAAQVVVLSIVDGNVLARKVVPGRVLGIRRSDNAFEALLGGGMWTPIEYLADRPSSSSDSNASGSPALRP